MSNPKKKDPFRTAERNAICPECGEIFGWNYEDGLAGQICHCGHTFSSKTKAEIVGETVGEKHAANQKIIEALLSEYGTAGLLERIIKARDAISVNFWRSHGGNRATVLFQTAKSYDTAEAYDRGTALIKELAFKKSGEITDTLSDI